MPRFEVLRLANGEALPLRIHKPARAPHGAGHLASDLVSPFPRAGSDAPSDDRFHGGRND